MLKKIITIFGLFSLSACTTIMAPLPKTATDWPFENKDKVTFVLTEKSLKNTVEEINDGKDNGEELLIEVKKNNQVNEYTYIDGNKVNKGNIWFKKSPENKDTFAFAFTVPFPDDEKNLTDEEISMKNTAIYSRGVFETNNGKTIFRTYVLKCPDDRLTKQTDCPYDTEAEAWNAAFTLPTEGDTEKDVIPFIVR